MAVGKFAHSLCREFPGAVIVNMAQGFSANCYRSAIVDSENDLAFLDGTIKWICQSPFRPGHRRKNWFIDVSHIRPFDAEAIDMQQIRFDTFRSGGKGGQNANKTETGARAVYLPLSISAVATDERSQHINKKLALERLCKLIALRGAEMASAAERANWLEHSRLVRGNALRVYEGMGFQRVQ